MTINWVGKYDRYTGYGRMNAYFVRELCKLGVSVLPTHVDAFNAPEWLRPQLCNFDPDALTITLTQPQLYPTGIKRQWAFTMYEDSSIPDGWADIINNECERLIVLCEHNAETFKNAGVCVPIHVVHGGTDPDEFPLIEDRPDRPYTFVALGDRGVRKGIEQVWQAFFEAFPNGEDVRLLIKIREGSQSAVQYATFADERITVWKGDVEHMSEVYRAGDCFVFPAYGEGWGMPPREAAMMGLPVIATDWSGLSVGIKHWAIPLTKFKMLPSVGLHTKDGRWAVPYKESVAFWMRWCYEHQQEARSFGRQASQWLRDNQTWTHSAQKLKALIEEYG